MKKTEFISNCCSGTIIQTNAEGHGICSECGQNCVPEKESEFVSIRPIPIEQMKGIKRDIPDLSWNTVFYVAVFLLLLAFIRDNLLM